MRKFLLSVATIFATNAIFGQITLEHTFTTNEDLFAFAKGNEMFYIGETIDNKLKIYSNFLYKVFQEFYSFGFNVLL